MVVALLSCAALAAPGAALAADIGANDDTGKFAADGGAEFYERMARLGLRQTVMTVRWTPSDPEAIQHRLFLDRAVPTARKAGVEVVFAVYPYPPREVQAGIGAPEAFGAYVAALARAYPEVRQFVIGNEPNQTAFWRPQLSKTGAVLSAPRFGRYLAAGYDALKRVDPGITVVGVGLSPRGNDNAAARNNVSTSPVRFLAALGRWYRASGRTLPLMDGFSYHPYPRAATDSLDTGYVWPNAGFVDLARLKQALWDAFHGTAQPTTVDGLRLYLDEVGWQVDTAGQSGYKGLENVRVTTEGKQAAVYGELVRRAACDPDVAQVNFFGFYDDGARDVGFQAALHRVDGTPRPAAAVVARAIAETGSLGCTRLVTPWRPATRVEGASLTRPVVTRAGTLRSLVGAREGASAVVCLVPASTPTARLTAASARMLERQAVVPCWKGRLSPRQRLLVKLLPPVGMRGVGAPVVVAARLSAETNAARTTVVVARPAR
jgi:hypothetical protein